MSEYRESCNNKDKSSKGDRGIGNDRRARLGLVCIFLMALFVTAVVSCATDTSISVSRAKATTIIVATEEVTSATEVSECKKGDVFVMFNEIVKERIMVFIEFGDKLEEVMLKTDGTPVFDADTLNCFSEFYYLWCEITQEISLSSEAMHVDLSVQAKEALREVFNEFLRYDERMQNLKQKFDEAYDNLEDLNNLLNKTACQEIYREHYSLIREACIGLVRMINEIDMSDKCMRMTSVYASPEIMSRGDIMEEGEEAYPLFHRKKYI